MLRSKVTDPDQPRRRGRKLLRPPQAEAGPPRFPMRELNAWLRRNLSWDHGAWLNLMDELEAHGYGEWCRSDAGKDAIGLYLETKRKNLPSLLHP